MSGSVDTVIKIVPAICQAEHCNKDGCRVDLTGAAQVRVIVDLDCESVTIPNARKRCDYLFVGEEGNTTCVVPIELKSGRFSASKVLEQLKGGSNIADTWLPQGISLQFFPILAHGKSIHKRDRKRLLSRTLTLRGRTRKAVLIRCGERLTKALAA